MPRGYRSGVLGTDLGAAVLLVVRGLAPLAGVPGSRLARGGLAGGGLPGVFLSRSGGSRRRHLLLPGLRLRRCGGAPLLRSRQTELALLSPAALLHRLLRPGLLSLRPRTGRHR